MTYPQVSVFGQAAGLLLILGNIVLFPGLMMFWMRKGYRGGAPPSSAYYVCERSLILAAAVLAAIWFVVLNGLLQNTGGRVLAPAGAAGYLVAGVLGAGSEALSLSLGYENLRPIITLYVIIAYVAQATLGGALLQAGLLAGWIGWATIAWNVVWLVVLPLIRAHDIYFPILLHAMPLVIGIALLLRPA